MRDVDPDPLALELLRDDDGRSTTAKRIENHKDLVKRDLGKLLLALERAQEERLARAVQPAGKKTPDLTPTERAEALAFLKSPDLVREIGAAFETCGLVGEGANSLAAYLACTSRKLDKPLAVIIQSTSAAGKSTLMEAVLAMLPEEDRVKYSAMTGQSLYYLGEGDLKHKVLAIVEEEGAEKASYALKLLQSEGELTIASTGKDPHTGRMETQEYHVKGPVMIFLTTTAVEIDEELLNRCLILTVDESKEQTERIHTLQRKARTLEGLRLKKRKAALLALLRNAQRLLLPLDVMNPFADELTFTADRTRTRRDHEKYLTLIEAIALLHQYQRPTERDPESGAFIRVTLDDIALANRLAPELLGRSLDELPPQTRRVLSVAQVETILAVPDVADPLGIRDRALLELLYSTGIRRTETARLRLADLNREKRILWVRFGKGRKDRVVPVGHRALAWVEKYIEDVRPLLAVDPAEQALFLTGYGAAFNEDVLGRRVHDYIVKAGIAREAIGPHLLRHTCATHMLEGGADIRFIQQLLGHEKLETTAIYTEVNIDQLQAVHARTHPAETHAKRPENGQ